MTELANARAYWEVGNYDAAVRALKASLRVAGSVEAWADYLTEAALPREMMRELVSVIDLGFALEIVIALPAN